MPIKSFEIKVFGRVQGVGFRFYSNKKAKELGLNGMVQNKADGSVYIEVEGQEEAIEQFIIWCENGPQWARVSKVQIQEIPGMGFESFKIN